MCCALTCSTVVSAQEGRMQDTDPALKEAPRNEPDPVLSTESDSRNTKSALPAIAVKEASRDSAQVQLRITKPTKASEKEENEEDPLSFNFLYYIIGKFKLNDIIE